MLRHSCALLSISALVLGTWIISGRVLRLGAPGWILSRDQASRVFGGQSSGTCNKTVSGQVPYCSGSNYGNNPCGLENCVGLNDLPNQSIAGGSNSLDQTVCSEMVCEKDLKKYSCGTAYVKGCS
jgi:hypothetical protein